MAERGGRAFGHPGIEPRWTGSAKDGVGTAYSTSSRVWFTLSLGILNEIYYPSIDHPQIRDFQYLITDGKTFFHDERGALESQIETLRGHALGYRVVNSDPTHRYRLVKEIIADPHQACVLLRTRLEGHASVLSQLRLFALCAPHLDIGGWGNSGNVVVVSGRTLLTAHKHNVWLALGASVPFRRRSCGYVGESDGWTDLASNYEMDWEFDEAPDGNIALTGELDLRQGYEFTLGLAFGDTLQGAVTTLFQSLAWPFATHQERFEEQWMRSRKTVVPLARVAGDGGTLERMSQSLLQAHEGKTYPGAIIASLSIPWGDAKGDDELGGYHLVWTRDMVRSALGLLAAGNMDTPLRALIYLVTAQQSDGGFSQNFWVDGRPYFPGIQLDEVAFPILLAWRLHRLGALQEFDPYPMVHAAAAYLIRHGPATPQDRWEEVGGYSPATLAVNIAALTCAASMALERGDQPTALFMQQYADFLDCHVDPWTVTTQGSLVPGITNHYIRIRPIAMDDPRPDEDPNRGIIRIPNRPPGEPAEFPAKEIVDAGFLELVRYGVRKARDPLIETSLRVIDAVLKVDTPLGSCWHRYNHDGYGQRPDGGPFQGWGKGRPWPLLTGERGHYELAAGRPVHPYIHALERFAHGIGLLPEQIWDEPDLPSRHLFFGRPTGAAMPLMWAHGEYLTLLRSTLDNALFDAIPEVAARYQTRNYAPIEVWKHRRQPHTVARGTLLRIQVPAPFRLHWSRDDWQTVEDTPSATTTLGINFVDISIPDAQRAPIRFTFYWTASGTWEGRDYEVEVR